MNPPGYEVILGKKISQNSQKATNEQKIEPKGKGSIIIMLGIQLLWTQLCSSSGTLCPYS